MTEESSLTLKLSTNGTSRGIASASLITDVVVLSGISDFEYKMLPCESVILKVVVATSAPDGEGLTLADGETLGEADGEADTEGDTETDGETLGLFDGEAETDGETLGEADGETETLGETLGEADGETETDGETLGETEGETETDGETDGDSLALFELLGLVETDGETLGLNDGLVETDGDTEGEVLDDGLPELLGDVLTLGEVDGLTEGETLCAKSKFGTVTLNPFKRPLYPRTILLIVLPSSEASSVITVLYSSIFIY